MRVKPVDVLKAAAAGTAVRHGTTVIQPWRAAAALKFLDSLPERVRKFYEVREPDDIVMAADIYMEEEEIQPSKPNRAKYY